ncbi:hypothetical protein [Candidatus Palauibacter sp.]|uniref:hypothetical protein n=1 Tax=Candidatus Palauibacter sp. TaxID=3101350 RepID=UPI003C6F8F65
MTTSDVQSDVREEALAAAVGQALESRFDAIHRKLDAMDLHWGERSTDLREDLTTVRLRLVKLHEMICGRLERFETRLNLVAEEMAALRQRESAAGLGAGGGGEREAASESGAAGYHSPVG